MRTIRWEKLMTEIMESTWEGADATVIPNNRVKVNIRCKRCGETFVLRGTRDYRGQVETGFKRCLCDNEREFDIETLE
ncbi:MAG: hypothetical protein JWN30_3 [Bacilli bacterium]|nr:hypothetical protein [Bacilli bacterium]